jgi:hypothetical protein
MAFGDVGRDYNRFGRIFHFGCILQRLADSLLANVKQFRRFSLGDEVFPELLEKVGVNTYFFSYFNIAKSHLPLAEKLALGEKGPPP